MENMTEKVAQIKTVVSSFPRPVIIVMRYLFAFLHQWVLLSFLKAFVIILNLIKGVSDTVRNLFCWRFFSVSQYSDENMMQPYNLAVCFGPSLLRGVDMGTDEVTLAPQINDLVKTMIIHHESIFPGPSELLGPVYEKCMTLEQEYWWVLKGT